MSWIGLRDKTRGYFNEAGLGAASREPVTLNAILPKGSLMLSFSIDSAIAGKQATLLRQVSDSPWLSEMSIELNRAGDIVFRQTIGDQSCSAILPIGLLSRVRDVVLTYTWNAPERRAMLSAQIGESDESHFVEVSDPLPLSLRDAIMLTRHPGGCTLTADYDFLAIADHTVAHGPLPSLCTTTLIPTPDGLKPIGTLKRGDLVTAADGLTAQVRWVGRESLPCLGRFASVTARAPFFGATRDLSVASFQRIEMVGTEVDYLFATDRVSVRVGDLPEQVVKTSKLPLIKTYAQMMLDRPVPVRTGGHLINLLDAAQLVSTPELRAYSVLKHLPAEMMPTKSRQRPPKLKRIETLTLCNLMAA